MKEVLGQMAIDPNRDKWSEMIRSLYESEHERFAKVNTTERLGDAKQVLQRIKAEYADLKEPMWRAEGLVQCRRDGSKSTTYGQLADRMLVDLDSQAIGMVAPEIDDKDYDRKTLKLSEYRGKVVVLVFSGSWCVPCKAMYPDLRRLTEEHGSKPFAVLSVMSDTNVETVRDAVAKGEIKWRCWWDGGMEGPISTKWNVQSWPQIYVLDHKGVIRYRNVRGEALHKAVLELLSAQK